MCKQHIFGVHTPLYIPCSVIDCDVMDAEDTEDTGQVHPPGGSLHFVPEITHCPPQTLKFDFNPSTALL